MAENTPSTADSSTTGGSTVPGGRRQSWARVLGLTVLVLAVLTPPVALAATSLAARTSTPVAVEPVPVTTTTGAAPTASSTTTPTSTPSSSPPSAPSSSTTPAPDACGGGLVEDAELEPVVVSWLQANLAPRTPVLSTGSLVARLCAELRPANLALRYDPAQDGTDPARWSADVVVSTPLLRAQLATDAPALEALPLLATFGEGMRRIDVRQRLPRGDAIAAARAVLISGDVGVGPRGRDSALADGLDPRLSELLLGFTGDDENSVSSILDFPATSPERAAGAPRRTALIESLNGQRVGTARFDAEVLGLQTYVAKGSAATRPEVLRVEIRDGSPLLVITFSVPEPSTDTTP